MTEARRTTVDRRHWFQEILRKVEEMCMIPESQRGRHQDQPPGKKELVELQRAIPRSLTERVTGKRESPNTLLHITCRPLFRCLLGEFAFDMRAVSDVCLK